MTPKEAERQAHRRARALATVRTTGRDVGALQVRLTCVEHGSRWRAVAAVHAGDERVVCEGAEGDDPTAALCALPGVLAATIEATRAQLLEGMREGAELPDPEPLPSSAPSPRSSPRPRRRDLPDDGQVLCSGCGAPAGSKHLASCTRRGDR